MIFSINIFYYQLMELGVNGLDSQDVLSVVTEEKAIEHVSAAIQNQLMVAKNVKAQERKLKNVISNHVQVWSLKSLVYFSV